MEKSKIILYSLVHAFGILGYIIGVAYFMESGNMYFNTLPGAFSAVPVLLLFVFSVGLMAVLLFGRPVYLFMAGLKREGMEFLIYTLGWLFVIIILIFVYMTQVSPEPYAYPMIGGSTQIDY